jgi:hypothetical protein
MGSKPLDWPLRKRSIGFENNLILKELLLLGAFKEKNAIAWPSDTGLTESETKTLLESLRKKNLIRGRAPYKLTTKGKKIVADHYHRLLAEYESSRTQLPVSGNTQTIIRNEGESLDFS